MKTDKKRAGGQSGFTLIEVMIATIILGVGLLTIAAGFIDGMRILASAPMQVAAKEVAASVIDDLTAARDSGALTLINGARTNRTVTSCLGTDSHGNPNCYDFTVDTSIRNSENVAGLFHIEITVTYTAGGIKRSYIKTTDLYNAG